MTNEKIDAFIPTTFKDINKVEYSIRSLINYFPNLNNIHVSMPNKGTQPNVKLDGHNIYFHNDFDILPNVNLSNCRFRPNWILQQLLKLCQNVTETRYVLIFDSDCILTDTLIPFDETGKLKIFTRENPNDESAYLRYMSIVSNNDICENPTTDYIKTNFIADMQIFDYVSVNEMISKFFISKDDFIEKTIEKTFWEGNHKTGVFISEYEMYGRYMEKYHNDKIIKIPIDQFSYIKIQNSQQDQMFTKEEIESAIVEAMNNNKHVLKLQSSCCACDISYSRSK